MKTRLVSPIQAFTVYWTNKTKELFKKCPKLEKHKIDKLLLREQLSS